MVEILSTAEPEIRQFADRARTLAGMGRFHESIALGQKANRLRRDTQLEHDLMKWRHLAFYEGTKSQPRPDWPPKVSDPFPHLVDQIPEIDAAMLSTEAMAGGLLHHGSLVVRNLLSRQLATSLQADVESVYHARHNPADDPDQSWYAPFETDNDPRLSLSRKVSGDTSILTSDSPRFFAQWADLLRNCGALDAVSAYLGERAVASAHKTRMYRLPADPGTGWHQDGAFLGGAGTRVVNLWVALSACGEDAPGLEIVPWRLQDIVPTGTHGSYFDWSVGDGKVVEIAGNRELAFPRFAPGDAMLFDHLCLHRTGVRAGMTRGRYAIETWMFAPSSYPDSAALVL